MKHHLLIVFFITLALISTLAPANRVLAQTYTQYTIQLNSDGSATWTVKQVSSLNATIDTWTSFQQKITDLVTTAANQTGRPMSINNESLQMSTVELTQDSQTTQYAFTWLNFSQTHNTELNVGDVFAVSGFFNRLFNDGELQIIYPSNYTAASVTPIPDQQNAPDPDNDSVQTLQWLGTQFFVAEKPSIILQLQQQTTANSAAPFVFVVAGLLAIVTGVSGGFVIAYRRKNRKMGEIVLPGPRFVATEEQKVLRALRSNGGSIYQSVIKEQFNFSKTKTSQLLGNLEKKGIISRYKNGRDKIVSLNEQAKGK